MTDDASKEQPKAELFLRELELKEPDWEALATRVEQHLATAPSSDEALFDPPLLTADPDERAPGDAPLVAEAPQANAASEPPPSISAKEASVGELDEGWASAPEAAGDEVVASSPPEAISGQARPEDVEAATEIEPDPSEPAAAPASGATGGVSLADLARASMARRGAGEARDIAKESLAVASQSRGQGERAGPRAVAAEPAPRSTRPAAAPASGERPVWIGVGIAAVGLAAGFGLYLAGQNSAPTQTVIMTQPERPATSEAPVAVAPETPRAAPSEPEGTAQQEESPRGHDVASLPLAPTARTEASKAEARTAPAPAAPTRAPEPPAPGKVAAENVVLEEEGSPQSKPAPDKPRADAALRPADDTSAGTSERPSAGAAQAAVGAVLGPARSCVAGQSSPSTAQVVFGSDGHVKSVSVGGAAAGTPAAGCIETALKKARVQPFAAPSFSLGVTVRPP